LNNYGRGPQRPTTEDQLPKIATNGHETTRNRTQTPATATSGHSERQRRISRRTQPRQQQYTLSTWAGRPERFFAPLRMTCRDTANAPPRFGTHWVAPFEPRLCQQSLPTASLWIWHTLGLAYSPEHRPPKIATKGHETTRNQTDTTKTRFNHGCHRWARIGSVNWAEAGTGLRPYPNTYHLPPNTVFLASSSLSLVTPHSPLSPYTTAMPLRK
jgi:hypothetical protein